MCNNAVLVIWRVVAVIIAIRNLYMCVFIGLSFGDDNKRRENPYSIVRLLYRFGPSLTLRLHIERCFVAIPIDDDDL